MNSVSNLINDNYKMASLLIFNNAQLMVSFIPAYVVLTNYQPLLTLVP